MAFDTSKQSLYSSDTCQRRNRQANQLLHPQQHQYPQTRLQPQACRSDKSPRTGYCGSGRPALSTVLGRLLAVAENYPNLRASDNFLELQQELADVEEKIAYARRFYNRSAQEYNIRIQSVPALVVSWLCRFRPVEYFKAEATDRKTVQVNSSP